MGVRVSLDGNILSNTPSGWDEARIQSKRGRVLKGLFLTYSSDLLFWGDGFSYINNALNENYCDVISVLIETDDCDAGVWVEEFVGIIQLTQISSLDVDKHLIKTKIFDDTFDAKINNNKSLKAFVDVGLSKNGENIQAASPVGISLFLPTEGTAFNSYIESKRDGFRVFDCFRFIIDYMTDGQIEFKSDLFSGEWYNLMLFNGKEVRFGNGGGDNLEISFNDLFVEMNKKFNISFAIEPTPSGYVDGFQLRLEETSYFEQDDALLTLSEVKGILMDFNKDELYSDIDIGSKSFDDDVVLSYPPINFKAFKQENYTLLGQCNTDKTLNLVSSYVIDTNVIEDILVNNVKKYDKKVFIIVTDGDKAIKYKEYDTPVSTGTDTSGTANKLTDSTADFISDGVVVGDMAVNMLTGLTANVDAIDSLTTLSLDTDIFNNGDDYQIRDSPFNYNDPLTNIRVISRFTGGLSNSVIKRLGAQGLANFRANKSTDSTHTSFPLTIEPVPYDDDSTPPFFDDGGNYDSTTNFEYEIPSSGLYGFRANALLRMNGQIGSELLINGDFSGGDTAWTVGVTPFNIAEITGGRFELDSTLGGIGGYIGGAFLRQNEILNNNHVYILNLDVEIETGSINIIGNATPNLITTPGSHTIILDYSTIAFFPYLQFTFNKTNTGFGTSSAILSINNVSLKSTTTYVVEQTIVRSSNAGVELQSFTDTFNFPFAQNQFQIKSLATTERTFSAFLGEKISIRLEVSNLDGSSNSLMLLTEDLNQDTQEVEYTEFETILTDDGGGDILPVDPSTFPIYRYKFKKGLKYSDFKALVDSPEKAILFSKNSLSHIFGWRNSLDYDRKTGVTSIELRSKTKIYV